MNCLIFDNGSSHIKYGFGADSAPLGSIPNCVGRIDKQMQILIGDMLENTTSGAALTIVRPFDKGYIVNWHCEMEIWNYILNNKLHRKVNPSETVFILTEPPFAPEPIQNDTNEVVFEEMNFHSYLRRPAAWFAAYEFLHSQVNATPPASLSQLVVNDGEVTKLKAGSVPLPQVLTVVDTGFSFTHIYPFIELNCIKNQVKRLNVGGRLLTNYLKEQVSFRQWNMMDEFMLINQVKEQLCYISMDFVNDVKNAKSVNYTKEKIFNGCPDCLLDGDDDETNKTYRSPPTVKDIHGEYLKKNFVLPDYHTVMKGFVKADGVPVAPNEQVMTMEIERLAIPEILFHPNDVGVNQCGIVEACYQSITCGDEATAALCGKNILLCGGNTQFPNFSERFARDIRPMLSDACSLEVFTPKNPTEYAWQGASRYWKSELLPNIGNKNKPIVTRNEYFEFGHSYCNEKFANW